MAKKASGQGRADLTVDPDSRQRVPTPGREPSAFVQNPKEMQTLPATNGPLSTKPVGLLLLISGFIGFGLDVFLYSTDQWCVEFAQLIAGVVKYPPAGAHYGLILGQVWSLINQLSALGIMAGL